MLLLPRATPLLLLLPASRCCCCPRRVAAAARVASHRCCCPRRIAAAARTAPLLPSVTAAAACAATLLLLPVPCRHRRCVVRCRCRSSWSVAVVGRPSSWLVVVTVVGHCHASRYRSWALHLPWPREPPASSLLVGLRKPPLQNPKHWNPGNMGGGREWARGRERTQGRERARGWEWAQLFEVACRRGL